VSDLAAELARGEALYRAGAYLEAAELFTALAARAPQDAAPPRLLGLCLLRRGDTVAAIDLLRRAHALAPDDPQTALHLGFGLHAVGDYAAAADLFRACEAALYPDPAPALNLAACLHALGEHTPAEAAARRARLRAPRLPQARYMLGLTRAAAGNPAGAEAEFAIAVRLDPGFADAWVNLGLARYRRDDLAGAKQAMRAALTAAPGHRAATANLAVFLRLTGQPEDAESLLRDALAHDPAAVELKLNVAVEHLQEGRAEAALALLDGDAPAEMLTRQHWLAQRALALIECDRADEAAAAVAAIGTPHPSLLPVVLWRQVLLALRSADQAGARAAAEAAEAALGESVLLEHRIMTHYKLAQFWIGQNERERGFDLWVRGHRILGRLQPYSRPEHAAFIDAAISAFDHARLHQGPRAGNADQRPVFIVGMPRSGTTLAEQIIGAHPRAHAGGERPALGAACQRLGGGWETAASVHRIAALDTAALDREAATYLAELRALAPDANRIVDKMPGNAKYLGLVALMLPGARIIHCTRDPRDIGLSIFTHRFFGYHPYAHDLADLGWTIGQHARLTAHWRAVLPNPQLTLALRDWVDDFDATLRRVLAFLDLPYDPACERFHEQDSRVRTASRQQVRQPVNARGLDRWPAFASGLQPMIEELSKAGLFANP
jgi:Flp pilus assembly protein TadD